MAFRDSQYGVIVGGDYKEPQRDVPSVATTSDGGRSWKLSPINPQRYFSAVAFVPAGHGVLAAGTEQYAWAESFSAKKWQVFSSAMPLCKTDRAQLNALAVIPKRRSALAVGAKGAIFLLMPGAPLKGCKG